MAQTKKVQRQKSAETKGSSDIRVRNEYQTVYFYTSKYRSIIDAQILMQNIPQNHGLKK